MAWRAYLAEPVRAEQRSLLVVIHYYDDTDPANAGVGPGNPPTPPVNVLHSKAFYFPSDKTRAEIQVAVLREGDEARGLAARAALINGQFPVGTTLAI